MGKMNFELGRRPVLLQIIRKSASHHFLNSTEKFRGRTRKRPSHDQLLPPSSAWPRLLHRYYSYNNEPSIVFYELLLIQQRAEHRVLRALTHTTTSPASCSTSYSYNNEPSIVFDELFFGKYIVYFSGVPVIGTPEKDISFNL